MTTIIGTLLGGQCLHRKGAQQGDHPRRSLPPGQNATSLGCSTGALAVIAATRTMAVRGHKLNPLDGMQAVESWAALKSGGVGDKRV